MTKKIPYDNPLIQAFAAEIIGESYPLSPAMTKMVLDGRGWKSETDAFKKAFVDWMEKDND